MGGYPCCCDPFDCSGCTCASEGPEASFYFSQTDDDPCTFSFFDDSDAGHADCGGSITSWEWKVGASVFSTAQNPTGIDLETAYGAGPWDVTLTVTTACCSDSVVMEVRCYTPPGTACCSDNPVGMVVTISGVTDAGICPGCDAYNATWFFQACDEVLDVGPCSGEESDPVDLKIRGFINNLGASDPSIRAIFFSVGFGYWDRGGPGDFSTGSPCKGLYSLTTSANSGTTWCSFSGATVSAFIF